MSLGPSRDVNPGPLVPSPGLLPLESCSLALVAGPPSLEFPSPDSPCMGKRAVKSSASGFRQTWSESQLNQVLTMRPRTEYFTRASIFLSVKWVSEWHGLWDWLKDEMR